MAPIRPKKRQLDASQTLPNETKKSRTEFGKKFRSELAKTSFKIFQPLQVIGFYAWIPETALDEDFVDCETLPDTVYRQLRDVKTVQEVRDQIRLEVNPSSLVDLSTIVLPQSLSVSITQQHRNQYPFGQSEVAVLDVAPRQGGVDVNDVDFILGGSALGMLGTLSSRAHDTEEEMYFCTRVPSTEKTLLLLKRRTYVQDLCLPSFQFEHLVTGHPIGLRQSSKSFYHSHMMQIDAHRVLFSSASQAMDSDEEPVKLKASNPHYWNIGMVFQMISGACPLVVHGKRIDHTTLTAVKTIPLSEVTRRALQRANDPSLMATAETNILNGLQSLATVAPTLEETRVYQVFFDETGNLQVAPTSRCSDPNVDLLPSASVVKEMLGKP